MSYLEDDLRRALRRTEPSEDFARRVLERLNAPAPEPAWWECLMVLFHPPRVQWVALSLIASIMLPVAGVQYRRERQLRAEGERAKQQLVFAMRVTGSKLHHVQRKVLETGRMDTRL